MKRKFSISMLLVMCVMLMFGSVSAFAADTLVPVNLPASDTTEVGKVIDKLNNDKKNTVEMKAGKTSDNQTIFTTSSASGSVGINFNSTAFDGATDKSRQQVLNDFVKALQASTVSSQSQQKIFDDISAQDSDVSRLLIPMVMNTTNADLYGAIKVVNPFLPFIRLVLGIGAFCIFLILGASTVVDLVFIGLPLARESLIQRGEQSKSGKIPFVSSDAISVIKETESALDSSGGYKNAYLIYFKRRVFTYIILSICVLYLVVGELGGLISWLLGLGSGFVQK